MKLSLMGFRLCQHAAQQSVQPTCGRLAQKAYHPKQRLRLAPHAANANRSTATERINMLTQKQKAEAFDLIASGVVRGMEKFWENVGNLQGVHNQDVLEEIARFACEEAVEQVLAPDTTTPSDNEAALRK